MYSSESSPVSTTVQTHVSDHTIQVGGAGMYRLRMYMLHSCRQCRPAWAVQTHMSPVWGLLLGPAGLAEACKVTQCCPSLPCVVEEARGVHLGLAASAIAIPVLYFLGCQHRVSASIAA